VRRDMSDSVQTKSYGERYGSGKIFFYRNASVFLYHSLFTIVVCRILCSSTGIYGLSCTSSSDRLCPKGTGGFTG